MSIKFGRIGTCEPPSEKEGLSRGRVQYGGLVWSFFKMAADFSAGSVIVLKKSLLFFLIG